ncbi:DUF3034 family protein [Sphingomonas immobilis]|uniref:DUF3034 family protein n=1 Tax=Sphingomonas immobilis TaxID=3063997 RepID=A0ABT8ZWE2_9SPHN|nr:DUF3034 family protein [Sphingomonas sp. CA1-15]MDO7841902.1 DUF3034 family protein [Sphingomonas sp. CA1-15]
MTAARSWLMATALLAGIAAAVPVQAGERRDGGKLVLTDGISTVEGSAGGGLATWAVIAGAETKDGIGGTVHATYVALPDFDLTSFGGAIGISNRVEFSYAHQIFDTRAVGAALGLGQGFTFNQDLFGAKVRLIGDAVYDQDSLLPQIAVGVQYKIANRGTVIRAVGGRQSRGTDFYASATKLVLSKSLLLGATVRLTKANQFGLLGFGGDQDDSYRAQFEGSVGTLLTPNLAIGGEYRTKPSNLGFAREQNAWDGFAAWSFDRHATLTVAYTDLGDIATVRGQRGALLSLRGRF